MRTETRDRHSCHHCARRFSVVCHLLDADARRREVWIRCPYCGAPNRVEVATTAAPGAGYWAERTAP